jgi:hypothetical protein
VEGGPGQVIDMGSSSKPCPEALAPIAATGAILSAPYLTRVGMPLYLPQAYGQIGGIQPALPAGKLGWVVAQALEETSLSAHNNVLNIQPNAAEIAELKGLGLVLSVTTFKSPEYLADKDEGVRSPGMEPQNPITGKWLHRVTNTRPLFRDYVAAVSGYLWFMERRYPKVYKVLMDPASTLDDFALSLAGYGTSPRYSDTKKLKGRLKEHLKAQAAYLAQRIKIMEASPCGAETGSEVGTLRAIQTDAARDGQP